jgi:hypothetical protein
VANTFITTQEAGTAIARTTLAALDKALVLPATVFRNAEADFVGGVGNTVNVKTPASLVGRTLADRNQAISYDDVTETSVPVALDTVLYHGARIEDEVAELDLVNFMEQVGVRQVIAVAEQAEALLADAMNDFTQSNDITIDDEDPISSIVEARKELNAANVPFANRYLAVSPSVEALLLKSDKLIRVDASGSTAALRDATVGRILGFEVITSNSLTDGEAIAYHRDAFAFVNRAPRVPMGVGQGASQAYQGLSVTWTMDYDPDYIRDRSLVRTLAGAAVLSEERAVKLAIAGS